MTSMLAFDIMQFFLLLNHCLLSLILRKARFDPKVDYFFLNYLVGRKTWYFWNNCSSPFFNVDIRVGQGSALSPILSALYLAPILHILEKHLNILKIPVSILSFIDDGFFIAQSKLLTILNSFLVCSYRITSFLLEKFGFILEYGKIKVFYFSRSYSIFDSPFLNLFALRGPILCSKST